MGRSELLAFPLPLRPRCLGCVRPRPASSRALLWNSHAKSMRWASAGSMPLPPRSAHSIPVTARPSSAVSGCQSRPVSTFNTAVHPLTFNFLLSNILLKCLNLGRLKYLYSEHRRTHRLPSPFPGVLPLPAHLRQAFPFLVRVRQLQTWARPAHASLLVTNQSLLFVLPCFPFEGTLPRQETHTP